MGSQDGLKSWMSSIRSKPYAGGGKRTFGDEVRPPFTGKGAPPEWWRFFPGDYVPCPNCNAINFMAWQSECECWLCKAQFVDEEGLPHFTTCPNYKLFIPGGGPKHKGASTPCRCFDGHVTIDDGEGNQKIRECVVCYYNGEHFDTIKEAINERFSDGKPSPTDKEATAVWKQMWKDANKYKPNQYVAHNIVRLGYFHEVTKNPENEKGKPIKEWVPCTEGIIGQAKRPLKCERCAAGIPRVHGRRGFWNVSEPVEVDGGTKGHLHTLRRYEEKELQDVCANCHNPIQVTSFSCASCNQVILDCFDENLSEEALVEAIHSCQHEAQSCPHCAYEGKARETIECYVADENGAPVGPGCDNTRRTTIFDVDLSVGTEGTGINSSLQIYGHRFSEITEDIGELMVPFDFISLLDVDLKYQAAALGMPNPFEKPGLKGAELIHRGIAATGGEKTRPYGK